MIQRLIICLLVFIEAFLVFPHKRILAATTVTLNTAGTIVEDSSVGTTAWTNIANADVSNNAYATAAMAASGNSRYIKATNFGASIPAGVTINGIEVKIEHKANSSGVRATEIKIVKGGVIGTTNNGADATNIGTTDTVNSYGTTTNLWGLPWTYSDINASNFGVAFRYRNNNTAARTISVDDIQILVHYNGTRPNTPSLDAPATGAIDQSLNLSFKTTSSDTQADYLRYKIQICTDAAMTTGCQIFDQTTSQTGWSGQNTQANTAYTSGAQAVFTIQTSLNGPLTYYWRSYAIDPGDTNTWSQTQTTPYSFITRMADCANVPLNGNHSISTACTFPGTINGVDAGTGTANTAKLTIGSGGFLTILSDQTIATGALELISGTITTIDGGKLLIGPHLYLPDFDNDGYPGINTSIQYLTAESGRARRSIPTDCNDLDSSKWQNITGYTDADNDGYGTGSGSSICSGATLLSGYVANNTDCNDGSNLVFSPTTCYIDADNDGYTLGTVNCTNNTTCASATKAGVGTGTVGTYTAGRLKTTAGTGTDCNDTGTNSINVYYTKTCYVDTDNDDYGSTTSRLCTNNITCSAVTWASNGNGTAAATGNFAAGNTDCNDNAYSTTNTCCTNQEVCDSCCVGHDLCSGNCPSCATGPWSACTHYTISGTGCSCNYCEIYEEVCNCRIECL